MVASSRFFVPRTNVTYQLGIQLNRNALLKNLTLSEFNNRRCVNCRMLEPILTDGVCNDCIKAIFLTD